ncbi:MAG: hypothetical protein KAT43_01510 [Nanoarchaeota archaeon]|nr:hypothetical protein [Nanoarchaeota archaeon]
MARLDDIIITSRTDNLFSQKQGTLFWAHTYTYESSSGLKLRSREECDWHYVLSKNGIYHTYEPNLSDTGYRPDFGIGNNFLLEICGMVESPAPKKEEGKRRREYKIKMAEKRKIFNSLGYNLIEIYQKALVVNGMVIKNVPVIPFILKVIKRYNPSGCQCNPAHVRFYKPLAA